GTGMSPVRLAARLAGLAPAGPPPGTAIPGRPARLQIAARLRVTQPPRPGHPARRPGPAIGAPVLNVQLADAAGVTYQVPAGPLPADGRRHDLTVVMAP